MLEFILGVVVGFTSNYFYRVYTYNRKPKLVLSGQMIRDVNAVGKNILRAKIVNKCKHDLVDIEIVLRGIRTSGNGNKKFIDELSRIRIDFLADSGNKDADNAYQTAFKNADKDIHNIIDNGNYSYLQLFVRANNSFYSSILSQHFDYPLDQILDQNYTFDSGILVTTSLKK